MEGCDNITALAEELGVRRKFLYLWREQLGRHGEAALENHQGRALAQPQARAKKPERSGEVAALRKQIENLQRQIGQKQLEVEFFKRTFAHVREAMGQEGGSGEMASTPASKPRFRSKVEG